MAAPDDRFAKSLPGFLGIEFADHQRGLVRGRMEVKPFHLAPNGYLHAASVVALADTACGRGAFLE